MLIMDKVQNNSYRGLIALLFWIILFWVPLSQKVYSQSLPIVFQEMQVNVLLIDSEQALIIDANPKALDFYGYTRDQLLGQPISFVNITSDLETRRNIHRAQTLEQNYFLFTHKLANGELRRVEIYSSPITEENQQLLVSIIFDVTQREAFQQSLIDSQTQLERAEEVALLGHWEADLNTGRVYASSGAFAIYGVPISELTLPQVQELPLPQYRNMLDQALENLIQRNIPYLTEYRIQRLDDGRIRNIRARAQYDPQTNRIFGTIQDITADKALERSQLIATRTAMVFFLTTSMLLFIGILFAWNQNNYRKEQNNRISNLLQEKEVLLKEVHHRIKNHMSSAISLLELQAQQVEEEDRDYSEVIQKSLINASSRLTSMMLIYDRLYKSESYLADSSKVYLETLSEELVNHLADSKEIRLETNIIDVQLDPKILMSLGMIVNEMITNSLKYAFTKETTGCILVTLEENQESLILKIQDDGSGIDHSTLESSKGFGWTMIQLTVEQLHGQMDLLNNPGFGIVVTFKKTFDNNMRQV